MSGDIPLGMFEPWIERHARRIGLSHAIRQSTVDRIEIELTGAAELIDMMEVACWLGPIGVWVEAIERVPLRRNAT